MTFVSSSQSPDTNCDLDPIPTSLVKQYSNILIPPINIIITLSISTGIFPDLFKSCSVYPHLKTYNLDKDDLSIIFLCLTSHSYQNLLKELLNYVLLTVSKYNLLNYFQSAYIKHHSTETTYSSFS